MISVFDAKADTDGFEKFCGKHGIKPNYIRKLLEDDKEVEKALWTNVSPGKFFPEDIVVAQSQIDSILKNSNLRIPEYQKNLCVNDGFYLFSPFSGKVLRSYFNVPSDAYHIAYAFKDVLDFIVLVGRWHGRRAAIFFPDLSAVFVLDAPEKQPDMVDMMWNSVSRVKTSSIYDRYSKMNHLDSDSINIHSGKKVKTLLIGLKENLGHYFWQEMSGIERVINMTGGSEEYDIVTCSKRWLSARELFPELKVRKYIELENINELFNYKNSLYEEDRLWIRPVGLRISANMKNKIYSSCQTKLLSANPERYNFIVESCSNSNVLWINLRSHNKTWISQVSGVIELSIHMSKIVPNFALFLDGFGDSKYLADEIKSALLEYSIPVFDGINIPFEESLIWAKHVSSYVSVIGSGLVLNSWLVSKSGVAHSNIAHLNQKKFWNDVSEGSDRVFFIQDTDIKGDGAMYGEYDFDWRILVAPLVKVMLDN